MPSPVEVGAVVIGRNEGERLIRCLDALLPQVDQIVYVDSGSTDDSVAEAERRGVEVVALDLSHPFTAARARNAGFERLRALEPALSFVQFLDGDCELREGWIDAARQAMSEHEDVVVVCGRRRERFPEATIWNALCDVEWDGAAGRVDACGGDALMRADALASVEGFRPHLIAGEEPDLCHRLTAAGGAILRLDAEMTWHDADMTRLGQWWQRMKRAGHAYAENHWDHRRDGRGFRRGDLKRILFWGGALPLAGLVAGLWLHPTAFALWLAYPLQAMRIARRMDPAPPSARVGRAYGWSCVMGKFPELAGVLKYHVGRLSGRRSRLIEYK